MIFCFKSILQIWIISSGFRDTNDFVNLGICKLSSNSPATAIAALPRHLQRTYSARETGEMQGLEKRNLTRITDAPAAFLIQLQRKFVRAFLVECSFDTH